MATDHPAITGQPAPADVVATAGNPAPPALDEGLAGCWTVFGGQLVSGDIRALHFNEQVDMARSVGAARTTLEPPRIEILWRPPHK